jgi:hypothetical protein
MSKQNPQMKNHQKVVLVFLGGLGGGQGYRMLHPIEYYSL